MVPLPPKANRVLGFIIGLTVTTALPVLAQWPQNSPLNQKSGQQYQQAGGSGVLGPGTTFLGMIRPNAYGPGIHADGTGRPFMWQPEGTSQLGPDPTLRVTPNAYGFGVHADQYGRIVQPVCPFGQAVC